MTCGTNRAAVWEEATADGMGGMSGSADVLDGLVERILRGSPYRFTTAVGAQQQSAAYRIRAAASVEAGWATPGDFPDGMERDAFDPVAVHVLGWDGDEPICTGRLVFPPGPLPTEEACGLVVEPQGQVVDVGRMAVLRAHQTFGHGTFLALLCALYREVRVAGHEIACGMMAAPARSLVGRLGVRLDELGPPRLHHGELRTPVRFILSANVSPIADRWDDRRHGGGPSTRQASTPPNPNDVESA